MRRDLREVASGRGLSNVDRNVETWSSAGQEVGAERCEKSAKTREAEN